MRLVRATQVGATSGSPNLNPVSYKAYLPLISFPLRLDCRIAPKGVILLVECPSFAVGYSGLGLPQGFLSTCLDYASRGMWSCGCKSHLSFADGRGCAGWCNLRVAQTSPLFVTRLFCLLFASAGRSQFKGSPPAGRSFWLLVPPTQSFAGFLGEASGLTFYLSRLRLQGLV